MSKMSKATEKVRTANTECKMLAMLLPDEYYVKFFMPLLPSKRYGIKVYKKKGKRVPLIGQGTLSAEIYPPSRITQYENASITVYDKEILGQIMAFADEYGYKNIIKEFDQKVEDAENLPKV